MNKIKKIGIITIVVIHVILNDIMKRYLFFDLKKMRFSVAKNRFFDTK
jgi:hypothetical protein